MKLYKLNDSILLEKEDGFFSMNFSHWSNLIVSENIETSIEPIELTPISDDEAMTSIKTKLLPPIDQQEVWASGVTYFRSRTARMEESADAGGANFYDKVYDADRPELFLKAAAWRVVGSGGTVNIRRDSTWDVPEPELTLLISPKGKITGYTIGNDMSSRSIEGENPLYLPQAKVYDGSAAIGPCILVSEEEPSPNTIINLRIDRNGTEAFNESTELVQMK